MLVPLLALQAAVPVLGTLPPQQLPARGCAAYLWSVADGRLLAMASAAPAQLRMVVDGAATDLTADAQQGGGAFGFAATTDYQGGAVRARLALTVTTRDGLKDGAPVPTATLTLDRAGKDSLVVPLAGLIGCRTQP